MEQASFYCNTNVLKQNQYDIEKQMLLNVIKSDNAEACGALKDVLDQKGWSLDEDSKGEIIERGKTSILSLFDIQHKPKLQQGILSKIPKSEEFPYFLLNEQIIDLIEHTNGNLIPFEKILETLHVQPVHYKPQQNCSCSQKVTCQRIKDVNGLIEQIMK